MSGQSTSGNERWQWVEEISGPFNIGHTSGSLCYLIDREGRPISEGYHEISSEKPDSGRLNNIQYIGKRGATVCQILPISHRYIETGTEQEDQP